MLEYWNSITWLWESLGIMEASKREGEIDRDNEEMFLIGTNSSSFSATDRARQFLVYELVVLPTLSALGNKGLQYSVSGGHGWILFFYFIEIVFVPYIGFYFTNIVFDLINIHLLDLIFCNVNINCMGWIIIWLVPSFLNRLVTFIIREKCPESGGTTLGWVKSSKYWVYSRSPTSQKVTG